jgi:flagellar motility protein MotE (MotC chaperone)
MKTRARWTTAALLLGGAAALSRADQPRQPQGAAPEGAEGTSSESSTHGGASGSKGGNGTEPARSGQEGEPTRFTGTMRANGAPAPELPRRKEPEMQPDTQADGERERDFSTNPNRHTGLASDQRAIHDTPRVTPLSASEEVLISTLRSRLQALDEREAAVAAREAALRGVLWQLQAESDRLVALRGAVDTAVDRRDGHVQSVCTELVSIERQRNRERQEWERSTVAEARRVQAAAQDERRKTLSLQTEQQAAAARFECFELVKKADVDEKAEALKDAKRADALGAAEARAKAGSTAARAENIAELGRIVKKMKPDEAARLLTDQDDSVALGVLSALGDRASAKILAQMPSARANGLTKALVSGGAP